MNSRGTPTRYAHSIKNPQIKHAVEIKSDSTMDIYESYLCIGCVDATPSKIARQKKDVTCKNCLRIIGKREICANCGFLVDDYVVIEDPPDPRDEPMKCWLRVGMRKGDIVCSECYVK